MATLTLGTTGGKTIKLDSTIYPSTPYLAINHNGVTYKASLSATNRGDFAINHNGKTYRTYTESESTDQVVLKEDNSLYKYNVPQTMLYDATANSIISPSTNTLNISGSHIVYVLPTHPYNFSLMSSYCQTKTLQWVREHLADFENAGLVAYSGKISDMPRNYERNDITLASGTTVTFVVENGSTYVWSSYSTNIAAKYKFLVDFAIYYPGTGGPGNDNAQVGAPDKMTSVSYGTLEFYALLDSTGNSISLNAHFGTETDTIAKILNFRGV